MSTEYPCIYFEKDGVCRKLSSNTDSQYCVMGPCPEQALSNADRIRQMTDEEIATLLCLTGWKMSEESECLDWLQHPAEGGEYT